MKLNLCILLTSFVFSFTTAHAYSVAGVKGNTFAFKVKDLSDIKIGDGLSLNFEHFETGKAKVKKIKNGYVIATIVDGFAEKGFEVEMIKRLPASQTKEVKEVLINNPDFREIIIDADEIIIK